MGLYYSNEKVDEMWDTLRDMYGVSEETLQIVTDINGYNTNTMEDVLYAVAGLNSFDQDEDEDEDEEDN